MARTFKTYRPDKVQTYPGGPTVNGASEKRVALMLRDMGVPFAYEKTKLSYHVSKDHKYTPDFRLPNGIFLEVKGWMTSADRVKHLLVKEQHPDKDIRFVFDNANKKLNKTSKTTYAAWCDKHGFKWCEKTIPKEWTE